MRLGGTSISRVSPCRLWARGARTPRSSLGSPRGAWRNLVGKRRKQTRTTRAHTRRSIVADTYVDGGFNHLDWQAELSEGLNKAAAAPSPADASKQIGAMLGKLDDPFTRWVPPREYADFRVTSDGEVQGVGLLIASDPASGRLVVLAPIKGSPADRAGIQPGDEVLAVDGAPTDGWNGEQAATHLRGANGSAVTVQVARPVRGKAGGGDLVPGVAGARPEEGAVKEVKQFRLRREVLEISPVFATAMHFDDHLWGYVRLVSFSQKAAADMEQAIQQLEVRAPVERPGRLGPSDSWLAGSRPASKDSHVCLTPAAFLAAADSDGCHRPRPAAAAARRRRGLHPRPPQQPRRPRGRVPQDCQPLDGRLPAPHHLLHPGPLLQRRVLRRRRQHPASRARQRARRHGPAAGEQLL